MLEDDTAARAAEELTLNDLYRLQEEFSDRAAEYKDKLATVLGEIGKRLGDSAKRALEQAGKEHGTLTLELQDGLKAKVDVKKTVSWDSEKLMGVAQAMPWDRVKEIFKIAFAVSETIYKGIGAGNPELKAKIDEARTVTLSPPKITLSKE